MRYTYKLGDLKTANGEDRYAYSDMEVNAGDTILVYENEYTISSVVKDLTNGLVLLKF